MFLAKKYFFTFLFIHEQTPVKANCKLCDCGLTGQLKNKMSAADSAGAAQQKAQAAATDTTNVANETLRDCFVFVFRNILMYFLLRQLRK
jgi:hypothetical protein